jgi:hypothetical protein
MFAALSKLVKATLPAKVKTRIDVALTASYMNYASDFTGVL